MKKYKMLIFDMDGTILYTLEDLKNTTNYALNEHGFTERTLEEVRRFVGNGIHKLIERAVPEGTSDADIEAVFTTFEIYYKDHCMDTTRPYDGINDLLTKLRAKGYMTAVVSNKVDFAVQDLVKDFFAGQFDIAIGEREGVRKKPAPDSVYEVLKEFDLKKDEVIYIGDSDVDVETARNAGVACCAVSWGFRSVESLKEAGAERIAANPQALLAMLEAL